MEAAENFNKTLGELESWVNFNLAGVCPLRQKVDNLRKDWSIFSAHHTKLVLELEQLKSTERSEGLKLITKPSGSPEHPHQSAGGNLFNRRAHNQVQNQQKIPAPPPDEDDHLEEYHPSPAITRTATLTRSPLSPLVKDPSPTTTATGAEAGVMDIVRRMSNFSASSNTPSQTSLTPSPTSSINSPDFSTTAKTIRQRGQEKKFEFFQEIVYSPILENVTCFVLSLIQVETGMLFDSLERCPSLTHIELIRVIFMGQFNRRVLLPKLKNFLVHQVTSEKRLCESKNLSRTEFCNALFFAVWEEEDPIPASVIRIEYLIDGWTQLKLNYDSGEFVSRLTFASDILHCLTSRLKLRRLALQACKFKFVVDEGAYEHLTYLNFQSILTSSHDLGIILGQCHNLQELRFKNYIDGGGIHLKDIPCRSMKFLCLGLCTYTLPVKYSPGIRFEHLDTLVFPTNIMDDDILQNIPSIFKTKKAIVYLCSHGARCKNGYFILDKLLQIESIEWIWLSNFRRSLLGDDLNSEMQLKLREKYEHFFISAGLHCASSTSIILEKQEVPSFSVFHNDKYSPFEKTFRWIGRDVPKEEHQVLEFQNRDGYKFSSWEAYMKRY